MILKEISPKIWNFRVVDGQDAWKEVVYSARMSGVPESVKDDDVFKMIVENDYGSALEHIIIKFDVKISKGNAPELLEHRMASHSGFSTRYVAAGGQDKEYEIIVPLHLLKPEQDVKKRIVYDAIRYSIFVYEQMISNGVPREVARYMLPFAQAVGIFHYTLNLRSLINFLSLRLCVRASPEMRCIASQLYFALEEALPAVQGLIGCRGFMMKACPESNVTGIRVGNTLKYQPTCPFRCESSACYIPTRKEKQMYNSNASSSFNAIQKSLYKQWSQWK